MLKHILNPKRIPPHVITDVGIACDPLEPEVAVIRVRLPTAVLCQEWVEIGQMQGAAASLRGLIARLLEPKPPKRARRRDGQLQPLIPRRLRKMLHETAERQGVDANAVLVGHLEKYIDFGVGVRRTSKRSADNGAKSVHVRIGAAEDFRARGRAFKLEPDRVRFTFNAGTARARMAVEKLIQAMNMNLSEFFAAVVERSCLETGTPGSMEIKAEIPAVAKSRGILPERRVGRSVRESD